MDDSGTRTHKFNVSIQFIGLSVALFLIQTTIPMPPATSPAKPTGVTETTSSLRIDETVHKVIEIRLQEMLS